MLQSLAGSSCVRLVERHRSAWCFGLLLLGYFLYLVFGAVVFSSVELPYEDLLRQELRKLKRSFVEDHKCLSEAQLERFLARVLEASNYGVSVLSNASANWNWDFTSSLFFASTVLSTTETLRLQLDVAVILVVERSGPEYEMEEVIQVISLAPSSEYWKMNLEVSE
uniref:Potassium channel sub K member 1 n=1 Tax=Sphaerodactylus townsendi TaxID=933632 RepID=A0ACB8GB12_9SAUR